ncbi:LuxQ periplasmic sensor domain-containing protein [Vibrio salinus]|uniref:LuxQ periplasmic sensor domain-containing protein n=1 Tax=Vibrio salinus TaxID=2899784 RepID=UPI001E30EBC9|nr:LuxQ periplasmic sensor domain-containing protein [Vibrio salinus]MCE0496030.1 ATP-binding protein [Vibrio salinus]
MIKKFQTKRKIATYFTRSITLVIGALTFGILFESYHMSSSLIAQEVERTANQTANLQQRVFNSRLSLLKIHQDSSVSNPELIRAIRERNNHHVERFFKSFDQLDPSNTPDFRFLADLTHPNWDDGSSAFYGIPDRKLKNIFDAVSLNNYWNLVRVNTGQRNVYVLARRAPIVDPDSGEVLGYLVVVFILNDNFHLIENLRTRSHAENLILTVNHEVLSTTISGKEPYTTGDILNSHQFYNFKDAIFISKTNLQVDDIPTQLMIFSVQNNYNIKKLRNNFYYTVVFTLLAMLIFSYLLWNWLHRRIRSEIETLMNFTYSIADKGTDVIFDGSSIAEFDHFGRVLEHTFHRLSEQEKQFENLFHYSIMPTILWGTNSSLLRMNPAAINYFSEDKKGTKPLFIELKMLLSHDIINVGKGAGSKEVLTEVGGRTYRWMVSPISSARGLESILTQGQDITTIAEAEKQSRLATKEAEKAASVRADFLARMSHEVRTPLNGILGVAQLLKSTVSDSKNKEQVGVLCACSEHLLAVLNDILDFSKHEHGNFQINASNFDLVDTIRAVEQIYRPLCEEKGLNFSVEHNLEHETYVYSDQTRLNQIIFNLLNNAVKFTDKGSITVRLNFSATAPEHNTLIVEITDTGIGLDESEQESVFQPFVQSESGLSKVHGGTGLGLAIVKNLVELFHGTIELESKLNVGSKFRFEMPISLSRHKTRRRIPNESNHHDELNFDIPPKVLLVEDNQTNAYIAKAFCEKYGLLVTWVEDGNQAVKAVSESSFDLIFMDNQLPNKDGIEVTRTLRKELNLRTPIFACTADGSDSTQKAFLNSGADFIIVKPIREEIIRQALAYFKSMYYRNNINSRDSNT